MRSWVHFSILVKEILLPMNRVLVVLHDLQVADMILQIFDSFFMVIKVFVENFLPSIHLRFDFKHIIEYLVSIISERKLDFMNCTKSSI